MDLVHLGLLGGDWGSFIVKYPLLTITHRSTHRAFFLAGSPLGGQPPRLKVVLWSLMFCDVARQQTKSKVRIVINPPLGSKTS